MVVRELVREGRDSVGRKLIDVPGYTFRIFVQHGAVPRFGFALLIKGVKVLSRRPKVATPKTFQKFRKRRD